MSLIEIETIFSIFHDGVMTSWKGDKRILTIEIGCQYLAERIDESFVFFFVELSEIDRFELDPWWKSDSEDLGMITDFETILNAELDILSTEINNDSLFIHCSQHNPDCDFCGGKLILRCKSIKVYDQEKNEISIEDLKNISHEYWREFGEK